MLFRDLDEVGDGILEASNRVRQESLVVGGTFVALSSGYVLWNLKTFYMLFSALAARPLWRQFDPLAILDIWDKRRIEAKKKEDEVERLFD